MGREPQKCKQCGREIYFDGICADCRAENQKKEILALTEEEIAIKIKEICEEIETTGDLDKNRGMFIKLLDYRDINTAKIAETAFKNKDLQDIYCYVLLQPVEMRCIRPFWSLKNIQGSGEKSYMSILHFMRPMAAGLMIRKEILLKQILTNAILWLRELWKRKRKVL